MRKTRAMDWVRFAVTGLGMVINAIVLPGILMLTALLRLIPIPSVQKFCQRAAIEIAQTWIDNNTRLFRWFLPTKFTGTVPDTVQPDRSYLVISNHQSWVDIVVLQAMFNRKAPFFRFFLKQQLIWVPIMGLAWWVLDFPFMKRLSKEQIAKNPELKHRDKEETIRRMQKFKDIPVGIMVFLEGTRFTQAKHDRQLSPYHHLLKPRAAGAAYALGVLSDKLEEVIDATISYPYGVPTFIDFLMGKCPEVHVDVAVHPIPLALRQGDYENDKSFRALFQTWINGLWLEKDQHLSELSSSNPST